MKSRSSSDIGSILCWLVWHAARFAADNTVKAACRSDFLEDLSALLAATTDRRRKWPIRHWLVADETRKPVRRLRRRLHWIYRVHAGQPGRPIGETATEGRLIAGRRNPGSRRVVGREHYLWSGTIDRAGARLRRLIRSFTIGNIAG